MWACWRNCSGHSNLRCSCNTESILVLAIGRFPLFSAWRFYSEGGGCVLVRWIRPSLGLPIQSGDLLNSNAVWNFLPQAIFYVRRHARQNYWCCICCVPSLFRSHLLIQSN